MNHKLEESNKSNDHENVVI